jgi:hypothetical protein
MHVPGLQVCSRAGMTCHLHDLPDRRHFHAAVYIVSVSESAADDAINGTNSA